MSERVRVVVLEDGQLIARKAVIDPTRREHEVRMLDAARHPGVVRLAATPGGATGSDLDTVWAGSHSLETQPPLRLSHAAGTMAALATTVADLHQAGITHGRIGASHVLIGHDGRPVLCGLGDARLVPTLTDPAHQRRTADDVAALGRLLRTLLEGQPSTHRGRRDRSRAQRRALADLAERACHDDLSRRPSARAFAAAVIEVVPDADLPPAASVDPESSSVPGDGGEPDGEVVDVSPTTSPVDPGRGAPPAGRHSNSADTPRGDTETSDDPFDRLRRTATEPPPRRPTAGRRRAGLALAVLVTVTGGALAARSWSSPETGTTVAVAPAAGSSLAPVSRPVATTDDPSSSGPTAASVPSSRAGEPTTSATEAAACPATQLDTANLAADIDGDRCPDAVLIDGNTVTVGERHWEIGRAGDAIAIADWDCDGTSTPALLRPPTGEVFVFDSWARPGEEVSVDTLSTIPGAALITPTPGVTCPDVLVTRRDGGSVSVPAPEK